MSMSVASISSLEMTKVLEERMREAARNGNTDVVQDLVDMGIDVNARQPDNGWYLTLPVICHLSFASITWKYINKFISNILSLYSDAVM